MGMCEGRRTPWQEAAREDAQDDICRQVILQMPPVQQVQDQGRGAQQQHQQAVAGRVGGLHHNTCSQRQPHKQRCRCKQGTGLHRQGMGGGMRVHSIHGNAMWCAGEDRPECAHKDGGGSWGIGRQLELGKNHDFVPRFVPPPRAPHTLLSLGSQQPLAFHFLRTDIMRAMARKMMKSQPTTPGLWEGLCMVACPFFHVPCRKCSLPMLCDPCESVLCDICSSACTGHSLQLQSR
jgi:hypothetical protein